MDGSGEIDKNGHYFTLLLQWLPNQSVLHNEPASIINGSLSTQAQLFVILEIGRSACRAALVRLQQGLEKRGLEKCGPRRYTVFNWIPKHFRYTDFGQKPWRYTVFDLKNTLCPFILFSIFSILQNLMIKFCNFLGKIIHFDCVLNLISEP